MEQLAIRKDYSNEVTSPDMLLKISSLSFNGQDAVQAIIKYTSLSVVGRCILHIVCFFFFSPVITLLCILNNFQIIQASYTTLRSIGKGCGKNNWKC